MVKTFDFVCTMKVGARSALTMWPIASFKVETSTNLQLRVSQKEASLSYGAKSVSLTAAWSEGKAQKS